MEFRYQASAQGNAPCDELGGRPTWRDYVLRVPEIGQAAHLAPELIAEEYRMRQLWGDRPSHDAFISRYPAQLTQLPMWLSRIDDELRADAANVVEPSTKTPFAPAAVDPRAPLPWSDYRLQEHLGSGGFGKVYRAVQKSLDRPVAVKALHKARQRDPRAVEQFLHEARLLARLKHPGIVGVHGLGRYPGGGYFLVLDLVEGEDLQRRIDRGRLTIAEAVRITIAVAEAIQHAHQHGVLHGDLKPSNVLCDTNGAVIVTDFGFGHLLPTEADAANTAPLFGGTLAFLAPEVARSGPPGIPVDVYGLGALLYCLLTGRPPHQFAHDEEARADREGIGDVLAPATIRSEMPSELETLAMTCLATNPATRCSSAAEFADALRRWVSASG
ncbi:MAG: serine/threonine-protein kinase [Pirellulaceae bacterium]